MTEHSQSPDVIWDEVVAEFIRLSDDPSSDYPALTAGQRGFLSLAKPVTLVPGYAVIATPHAMSKKVIEQELGDSLARVLSRKMGQPYSLAVSIDPNPIDQNSVNQNSGESRNEQPAPQAQSQSSEQQSYGWRETHAPAELQVDGRSDNRGNFSTHQHSSQSPQSFQDRVAGENRSATSRQAGGQQSFGQQTGMQQPNHAASSQNTSEQPHRIPRETPAHNPNREISLNPKYTFESFVIGSSNRFANAAAVAVAESLARAYNPLFIWGGSGLGKTHLLHAIGNYATVLQPGLRVKYVSSEEFTNDYINSVRDDRQESFKRRYRNLDILMVDDIQFLEGKEGTQEEFFHTFNALHQADKQIVLSSDRPPKQLTTLTDRLRTRFEAGLITDIQPPDLETRIAILSKKAQSDGTVVNRDVLELIASRFESSIRELEGALIRVSAYASLVNEPIDSSLAEVALRDIMPDVDDIEITTDSIMETTADYFNITLDALRGTGKTRAVAHARQLAMYLCRELTDLSLPRIGSHFGGKDHTTVMYADRKIRKEMTEKRDTYDQIQELTQMIKSKNRM